MQRLERATARSTRCRAAVCVAQDSARLPGMSGIGGRLKKRVRSTGSRVRKKWFPPTDMEDSFKSLHETVSDFTMTSIERQYALWQAVRHLRRVGITGDFVECGVWKGGSMMLMALTEVDLGEPDRDLWLYDFFGVRYDGVGNADPSQGFQDEVEQTMVSTGYPADRIHLVPGKIEDTIPAQLPESIALLRLDTNWYESTKHEIEHLWPLLKPGGVLIIDDYGHRPQCRKAIDEFFSGRDDAPLLNRVDSTGRIAIKR